MKKILLLITLGLLSGSAGAVTISSVNGSVSYGSTLQINGSDFGTKPVQQQTYFFANGEDASAGVAGSSWCVLSSMGDIQNIVRKTDNCFEGNGCFGPTTTNLATNKNNTANINFPDLGVGGQFFASWVWRWFGTAVATNVNWKTWRMWPSTIGLKNDAYGGEQADGSYNNATENTEGVAVSGQDRFFTTRLTPKVGSFGQIEQEFQMNSGANVLDGKLIFHDGTASILNATTWKSNTAADVGAGRYRNFYLIHMVITASAFPSDGDFRYDNMYFDTSWCAAWVTTDSGGTGTKYWLPVQTWVTGQITAVFAQNAFTNGQTVYLWVRKSDLTVNGTPFPLVVSSSSSGGGGPPSPTPNPNGVCPCLP